VNKKSALLWLIRRLGVEGVESFGEPIGTNVIYFGDEVALHGNDLCTAEIEGAEVFAVNASKTHVPFNSRIMLPEQFCSESGPEATNAVLRSLCQFTEGLAGTDLCGKTPLCRWKELRLAQRMLEKAQELHSLAQSGQCSTRRLTAAAATLSVLTREGRECEEVACCLVAHIDRAGLISARAKASELASLPPLGSSYDPGA